MPVPAQGRRKPRNGHAEAKLKIRGASGPLVLATDASVIGNIQVALGFLCTNGRTGFRAHPYPLQITGKDRVTVAELRAVHYGLQRVLPTVPEDSPLEVRTDSQAALSYLREWTSGSTRMPASYSTAWRRTAKSKGVSSLETLAELAATNSRRVKFSHVKGHAGDPLNEGAHYMAFLGAQCVKGRLSLDDAKRLAKTTMETSLAVYAA